MADLSYLTGDLESPNVTPQSKAIPGREADMKSNKAGGVGFAIDKWSQLQRFLVLGSESGTYYASQRETTQENATNLLACIAEDGLRTVRIVTEVSVAGRAPKNDPAIFALALASVQGDQPTRSAAYNALSSVCRIGTHLFTFCEIRKALTGKASATVSGGMQRALAAWYTDKEADKLAYQLIKYQSRGGWTHRDVLRQAKPVGRDFGPVIDAALGWATGKDVTENENLPAHIEGFELAKKAETPAITAQLVRDYRLPREALKTEHLNSNEVWEAMLDQGMPMTALIRNLATMTRNGLLTPTSNYTKVITDQLTDAEHIAKSKVHPITVFMALKTYASGKSQRGSGVWQPVGKITDALDDAFYMAFDNVEATGKRKMIALDISGSMWANWGGGVAGIDSFTSAQAAGVMAMVSIKTGDPYEVVAFASGTYGMRGRYRTADGDLIPGLRPMGLSAKQRLDDVDRAMQEMSRYMSGTDASLPMLYAAQAGREIDVFECYTDNESWAGRIQPSQALKQYRQKSGIDAKLVTVAFTATDTTIGDTSDPGTLDVVGFDSAAPSLISAFVAGQF